MRRLTAARLMQDMGLMGIMGIMGGKGRQYVHSAQLTTDHRPPTTDQLTN